jgi:hypothetical protein
MILISTLPVKGEESLDLQSPLTTSPNLDNCISTPLPEQPVDSDDRHGFLTGRCGRHRYSGEAQPLYKYDHATTCTLHRQAARLSRAVWSCDYQGRTSFTLLCLTCSSTSLVVPLTLLLTCKFRLSLALHWLSLPTAMLTNTLTSAVVLSLTCS